MAADDETLILVGTYTQPEGHAPGACGEGIVTLALNTATGQLERRSVFRDIVNASYLAYEPATRSVYSIAECNTGPGEVRQFRLEADGSLTPLARQSSHGRATCHLFALPDGGVCAASYTDPCVAVYPVQGGLLQPARRVFGYQGSGPNPQRQESSHPHQVALAPGDQRWFYICDLGADCIWRHDVAAADVPCSFAMPAGDGPRHMVFHPVHPRAYVLGELTCSVTVCDWEPETGALTVLESTPARGDDAAGAAIHIHPSLRCLYVSERRNGSLLAFPLDNRGMPGEAVEISFGPGTPRDFDISADGRWLLYANQTGNELLLLALDPGTGLPAGNKPQRLPLNSPACVMFIPD